MVITKTIIDGVTIEYDGVSLEFTPQEGNTSYVTEEELIRWYRNGYPDKDKGVSWMDLFMESEDNAS